MFGKYFKHVLIMTILAGTAYSLPQVKDAMVGAFGFSASNEALVIDTTSAESTPSTRQRAIVQQQKRVEQMEQMRERDMVPPEEIVATLLRAGIIPREKVELAIKVLKQHASSTRMLPPFSTTTPPFHGTTTPPFSTTTPPFSSTTRPIMRDARNGRINVRIPVQDEAPQPRDIPVNVNQ